MSDPKRYAVEGVKQNNDLVSATVTIGPDANGDWVRYEDYARLKAEVKRLTKAGDKMAHMHRFFGFPSYTLEWEAAKEGKQP